MILKFVLLALVYFAISADGATKEINPVSVKKGSTGFVCQAKVNYNKKGGGCDINSVQTKCKGSAKGKFNAKVDMSPECPCEVSYKTVVKKSYKAGSAIDPTKCEASSGGGGGGGHDGDGKECTCELPMLDSIMSRSADPTSADPSAIIMKVSDLLERAKTMYPALMRVINELAANDGLLRELKPAFDYFAEGSFKVDQRTSLVEYVPGEGDLRTFYRPRPRPSSGLGSLIPLILIPIAAAVLPAIVTAIINAITGNRMLVMNSDKEMRLEAFLRAVENVDITDIAGSIDAEVEGRGGRRHRGGGGFGLASLLGPIIALALGAALGQLITTALGLRRSALDPSMLDRNSQHYRYLAFSRAMEENMEQFVARHPSLRGGGGNNAIRNMILMVILQNLSPFITNIIQQFRDLIGLRRSLQPQTYDTEAFRGLDKSLERLQNEFFLKINPESRQLSDPCGNLFLRPTFTKLGFCVAGTMPERFINLLQNLNACKKSPACQSIMQNAKLFAGAAGNSGGSGGNSDSNPLTDLMVKKVKEAVEKYLDENKDEMLEDLEEAETTTQDFVENQGPKIMEDGKEALSELQDDMKDQAKKYAGDLFGEDGFKIKCYC